MLRSVPDRPARWIVRLSASLFAGLFWDTVEVWRSCRHGPATRFGNRRAFPTRAAPRGSPVGDRIFAPPRCGPPGGRGGHDMRVSIRLSNQETGGHRRHHLCNPDPLAPIPPCAPGSADLGPAMKGASPAVSPFLVLSDEADRPGLPPCNERLQSLSDGAVDEVPAPMCVEQASPHRVLGPQAQRVDQRLGLGLRHPHLPEPCSLDCDLRMSIVDPVLIAVGQHAP